MEEINKLSDEELQIKRTTTKEDVETIIWKKEDLIQQEQKIKELLSYFD